jgi:hypothetical protein
VRRLSLLLTLVLSGCALAPPTKQHPHDHDHDARAPLPAGATLSTACRQGAFLEASSIINSLVEVYRALPPNAPPTVLIELDSALYVALKQANADAHCVAGGLRHGYDQSFAEILERGATVAEMRGLKADVVAPARAAAQRLRDAALHH